MFCCAELILITLWGTYVIFYLVLQVDNRNSSAAKRARTDGRLSFDVIVQLFKFFVYLSAYDVTIDERH